MSHAVDVAHQIGRYGLRWSAFLRGTAHAIAAGLSPRAPTITVVVPVYNAARTIDRTLRSLRTQTFGGWEAVLVDDGSTDESLRACQAWARRDARIRVIPCPHAGVSAARNKGLDAARGEWVLFLDSDDYLHRRALQRLHRAAQARPQADVIAGAGARVDAKGVVWSFPRWDLSDPFAVLSGQCALVIHSALVRLGRARAVGGFDESLQTSEDWDFWQKLARTGAEFHQIKPVVAYYQSNPGSLSKRVRQLVVNTFEVMRRGHGPDPRVANPLPAYAEGASSENLGYLQLNFVLWSAGREIAGGGEGVALLDVLDPAVLADVDLEPEHAGEMIAAGMADLLSVQPHTLASRWPEIGPKLVALLRAAHPEPHQARRRDMILLTIKNKFGVRIGEGEANECPAIARAAYELGGALTRYDAGGEDVVCVQILRDCRPLGLAFIPQLGARDDAELIAAALGQVKVLPMSTLAPVLRPWRTVRFWLALAQDVSRLQSLRLDALLGRDWRRLPGVVRHRLRHGFVRGVEAAARIGVRPPSSALSPHARRREMLTPPVAGRPVEPVRADRMIPPPERAWRASEWNAVFAAPDPWDYAHPYEQAKHDEILELIPQTGVRTALELACAQGRFTAKLAARVGRLRATDISSKAIEGAAARCLGLPNVELAVFDFAREPIRGAYDLIVCTEALHLLGGVRRMRKAAAKMVAALNPGGLIVISHANEISDDPAASGFDRGVSVGAKTIADTFATLPDMELAREIRTPLYRTQAFRKRARGAPKAPPAVELRPLPEALPENLARQVIWGGAAHSRIAALRTRVTPDLPVLMYHRIADDGPAALARWRVTPGRFAEQMRFLRSQGYWTVTPEQWADALARNAPLPGRPIMLTFDDAYEDFGEHAWPILKAHDLGATLFVVADKAGGAADWDAIDGAAAPLLPWHGLRRLAEEGVSIGAHGFTHRPLARLSTEDLYLEALRTRARIAEEMGLEPLAFCYPYGSSDRVVEQVVADCGYSLGFSCASGVANLSSNAMHLPRIEITGADDLVTFSRKIGRPIS